MADMYDIMESNCYPKWRSWIYKLRLKAPCNDPVNNLFDIVNSICYINNPHKNTAIRFGCKDSYGMELFINRFCDGKIVLFEDVCDREYFHKLIHRDCANSISIHLTSVPFEWMVQKAAHGKLC